MQQAIEVTIGTSTQKFDELQKLIEKNNQDMSVSFSQYMNHVNSTMSKYDAFRKEDNSKLLEDLKKLSTDNNKLWNALYGSGAVVTALILWIGYMQWQMQTMQVASTAAR
jgi:catalase (peroxidase I)